jgi:hypothetical protein
LNIVDCNDWIDGGNKGIGDRLINPHLYLL